MKAATEHFEFMSSEENGKGIQQPETMGTVTFTDDSEIYLVPAPSADPRGELHL